MVWRAPVKYEGIKEASLSEVVPPGCSIAKVTTTDNSSTGTNERWNNSVI